MLKLISLLLSSNAGKASLATIGSGGLLTIMVTLNAETKKEFDQKLLEQKSVIEEKVDLKFEAVKIELKNLDQRQTEANKMLRDIHGHLLNK